MCTLVLVARLQADEASKPQDSVFAWNIGEQICIVGNTFAERMQHDGWLETYWQLRFPRHQLVVRNLGFSGDELTTRLRSMDFGSPDEWLGRCQATAIVLCFGYNESFAGVDGLNTFRTQLSDYIDHLRSQHFDKKNPPRLVLISPIPHEDLHDPHLPDGSENNHRLALYVAAMENVAGEKGVPFVNLFRLLQPMYAPSDEPLTINGVHLNESGNRIVAELIDRELFGPIQRSRSSEDIERLRSAIADKNFHWFQRYRTTDGYSIYGGRADLAFTDGQTNREVMQREMEVLDAMTANRDRRIWSVAQGKDEAVDDSNTPSFLPVVTNFPGTLPDGKHEFLSGEDAIAKMTVHEKLQVQLFASEAEFPELASPVQMSFDPSGRLWVAVWPSYPHWKPKEEMNDKLLVFTDSDGDGRADQMTVFADKLHNPTGFEIWGNGVFVAQVPDVLYLEDTDGDGRADVRLRILHGLDSADTHHAANSFVFGPGGDLYFQEGTFHHTQVETPWRRPVRSANAAVFRFEPRTWRFDVYVAYPFANPHGHVFDAWGQDFVTDGTGNVNYYAAGFSGHVEHPAKHDDYFPFFAQRVRPAGATEILSSSHFPAEFQGRYLIANVIGFQGILQYEVSDDGSGFQGREVEPIVFSGDPNFRPVDMEIGPDGAIYFLDWQNPIIGHMQHCLRDPNRDREHGRVYRVTYRGRPMVSGPTIAGEPIPKLVSILQHPDLRVRVRARMELARHDSTQVIAATKKWLAGLSTSDPEYPHHLLEALWVHQQHDQVDQELLQQVLKSTEPRARAAGTRVLCYWRDRVAEPLAMLATLAEDESPRVRLETVRACSFFEDPLAAEVAVKVLGSPTDRFIDYCLKETIRTLEPYWLPALQQGNVLAADNMAGQRYLIERVATPDLESLPLTEPVCHALLSRPAVPGTQRERALAALASHHGTDLFTEWLAAIQRLDQSRSANTQQVVADLAHWSMTAPAIRDKPFATDQQRAALLQLARQGQQAVIRQTAWAWLADAGLPIAQLWKLASQQPSSRGDLVLAVPLIQNAEARRAFYPYLDDILMMRSEQASAEPICGRYIRIELPGPARTLTLAEVEVLQNGQNIARKATAAQSGTVYGGEADRAIDGNTSGTWSDSSQTHTPENVSDPWWECDLTGEQPIDRIVVWNRSQDGEELRKRLDGFRVVVLDHQRQVVFERSGLPAPESQLVLDVSTDIQSELERAAIQSFPAVDVESEKTFRRLSECVQKNRHRTMAIRSLRRMPRAAWVDAVLPSLVAEMMDHLESLNPDERTTADAMDELTLARNLAAALPRAEGAAALRRLRSLGANLVILRSVPHLMIFDRTDLYVEAGQPVQILFQNPDYMPHNLVIAAPGGLLDVGLAAEKMALTADASDRQYVPSVPEVLHATRLLQPGEEDRLNFTAPAEVGDYPYLCTFPGHWRRMYGTLHVVANLDDVPVAAMSTSPEVCAPTRSFVREWQVKDIPDVLGQVAAMTSTGTGEKLFQELSCAKCHQPTAADDNFGPDLADIAHRLMSGDLTRAELLEQIIDPSSKIDPQYRGTTILTEQGRVHSGIIRRRDDDVVVMACNPLDRAETIQVPVKSIDEEYPTDVSFMPQGLLNTLTADEIRELLHYLEMASTTAAEVGKETGN